MRSIFDQRRYPKFEEEMQRRTGERGLFEVKEWTKQGKAFEEKDVARGFDIARTWNLANQIKDLTTY